MATVTEPLPLALPDRPAGISAREADPFFDVFPGLETLKEQLRRVAPQDTTLLLTGETGTGKTRLARRIHELSPRRDEPFLVVDCGALSVSLIESEMFGHVKGSFTGADRNRLGKFTAVGHGTLLLDEINSLPLALQGKLLRVVDDRLFEPVGANRPLPLQARIVAAANLPLEGEVVAGRFRSDLYYRLNVVGFHLPPLRERRQAILLLAGRFLAEFAARNRPELRAITREAAQALEEHDWPGNIRELRNVIERAAALCPGANVELKDLPDEVRSAHALAYARGAGQVRGLVNGAATLARTKDEVEILRIKEALQKHRNNRLRAAAELGISRMALYNKLHKYNLIDERPNEPGRE